MYFELTEIKLRFQKNKTRYGNTLWTAGYIFKKRRDSLAKHPAEPVPSNINRWIRDGWFGLNRGKLDGTPAGKQSQRRFLRRRHRQRVQSRDLPCYLTKEEHRDEVENKASSPR
jgi:hypothetical protein